MYCLYRTHSVCTRLQIQSREWSFCLHKDGQHQHTCTCRVLSFILVGGPTHVCSNARQAQSRSVSAYRETVLNDLRSLDTIVAGLERRAAELRATITRERERVAEMKDMRETARQRTDDLAALCERLPQHLPHAAPSAPLPLPNSSAVPTTTDANSHCGGGGCLNPTAAAPAESDHDSGRGGGACRVAPSAPSAVPTVELVTVSELEGVARSTRGRLSIAVINDAVTEIQKAIERR